MAIDLMALATTAVTAFLVPYAKAGLDKIADAVTDHIGEKAADYISDLTGKVWELATGGFRNPEEQTVIDLFRKDPDLLQELLIKKLHEKLSQDPALAQSLTALINQPDPDGTTTGAQIMQAGIAGIADLREANLSQAQGMVIAGVVMGEAATPKSTNKTDPKDNG